MFRCSFGAFGTKISCERKKKKERIRERETVEVTRIIKSKQIPTKLKSNIDSFGLHFYYFYFVNKTRQHNSAVLRSRLISMYSTNDSKRFHNMSRYIW